MASTLMMNASVRCLRRNAQKSYLHQCVSSNGCGYHLRLIWPHDQSISGTMDHHFSVIKRNKNRSKRMLDQCHILHRRSFQW
ncbi:hypothetical protein CARUB_v10012668mg [Capsella rubella]|uniref:Uncharacterized protein n=1 Tax=Capsella rubella TaxID=81985 RepID=R0GUI2_9BRAS|nr:hypothetical protein CARUB_v10012668mg [Capsella rubella]